MGETVQKTVGLIGLFDTPDALVTAARAVRDSGHKGWDCHTPYPVHGLDEAMGLKPSPMPYVTLTAGFLGLMGAVALTGGLSAWHYPIPIGGKTLFSWQAFVPIFFELFVLCAALATMGGVFYFCKLFRWHSPLHDTGVMGHVTCDRFAIVLESGDEAYLEEKLRPLLRGEGCEDIRLLMEDEDNEPLI